MRVVPLADDETVRNAFFDRSFTPMKIRHFEDTDTLLIELKTGNVAETRDLDENTMLDLDAQGHVLAITLKHATTHAELSSFSFDRVAAVAESGRPPVKLGSRIAARFAGAGLSGELPRADAE